MPEEPRGTDPIYDEVAGEHMKPKEQVYDPVSTKVKWYQKVALWFSGKKRGIGVIALAASQLTGGWVQVALLSVGTIFGASGIAHATKKGVEQKSGGHLSWSALIKYFIDEFFKYLKNKKKER